jgi:hypothetical protein
LNFNPPLLENSVALKFLCGMIVPERFAMADQENNIETLENQFPSISGSVFAAAREQALAAGRSVLQSEGEYIYEVFPDGRRVVVKKIEPPIPVVPGSIITIR